MKSIFISFLSVAACAPAPPAAPVAVLAASSLKEVVTDVAGRWSRETGRTARLQFEASSTLARQVREGAAADVFLPASPDHLDGLKLLDRFDWLSNRLVLVVRKERLDPDLRRLDSLALAGERAPAGRYAKAAFDRLGIALPARTIYGSNARDVLAKVSRGGAEAGIVYATDAAVDPELRVAFDFPPDSHPKIVYAAALLAERGRGLFEALRTPWAREIARRRGFLEAD